ncbi:MAG: LysR family transcriptional regulator [Acetobacteraceae bacterium]|nr:LysR family transcriptional regulator [Acetobacteraceae bacterium]
MAELPRDILLFVAAYEERSFTAAAAREAATQSGVSQHVRKLEERFGALLFTRDGGRVSPTPAADRYYLRCLEILRAHAAAREVLRECSAGLSGEVRVGLMPTVTRCALAPALAAFIDRHPNVSVRVHEGYSGVLTDQVQQGGLDFAVVPGFPGLPGLMSRPFATTPEVLVAASGPHAEPVRLATLGPLSIVLPSPANTRRQTIETYLRSNEVPLARTITLDTMLATLDMVATTGWVAILPGVMMARDRVQSRHVVRTLADPALSLDLVTIEATRRPLSAAATAFRDLLQETTVTASAAWAT